jgi:uncharacterized protein (UPF0332 family)
MMKKYGDFYRKMEIMREKGEYDCFYDATAEDVQKSLPCAQEMLDTIAAMVQQ